MKILIITPFLSEEIGGMERFVLEFSSRLKKQGHTVTILTGKTTKDIHFEEVSVIRHKIFLLKPFSKFFKYLQLSMISRKHLNKNKYDLVLAMGFSGLFIKGFIWRASGSPIPLVRKFRVRRSLNILSRFILSIDLFLQEWMEKTCLKNAKLYMFPSIHLKNLFEEYYKISFKKYFIPCSGTGTIFRPTEYSKEITSKIPESGFKILTVGGLAEERKGSRILLEALSLIDMGDKWLISVGKIVTEISPKISGRVIHLGYVDFRDMSEVYKKCDLLVFPSIYEGFPNVLLEAASYGLPIIASRLEGLDEYFKEDDEILLVDKGDSINLAKKIMLLHSSPEKRRTLSENIKKRTEYIDYNRLVEEFIYFASSDDERRSINLLERR